MILICISQTARINIDVVSARQLAYLENMENDEIVNEKFKSKLSVKDNGLSVKLNQAGIFPIIIASNIFPFLTYLTKNLNHALILGSLLQQYFRLKFFLQERKF